MTEIRGELLHVLQSLATAGAAVDALLIKTEAAQAAEARVVDEQPVQTLGGLSREIWTAHQAVQRAIRTTHQYERLEKARDIPA